VSSDPRHVDRSEEDDLGVIERRPEVVRRLLERGIPTTVLVAMLPDWEPLLEEAGPPDATGRSDL
jgi:hypothetical protein